jgi:glutamate carboxypeptidase
VIRILERLIDNLRAIIPQMHALMQELVCINSYSSRPEGVNAVGSVLARAFALPGLTHWREQGGAERGDHLFWRTTAHGAPLVLIGHHDTVFPPGHFEGYRVEGQRAYGPGTLDMKGGLAMIWGVLKVLSDASLLGERALVLASVSDEEVGSLDSRKHLEALAHTAQGALVFEAGRERDAIITQRRGVGTLRVIATGVAAHAGNEHHRGRNAITSLARFIDCAQSLTDYERGTTVNTGLISGGTSANTVPGHAEATLDLRFEHVSDAEELMNRLQRTAQRVALEGTELRLEGGIKRLPMERSVASVALYEAYARAQLEAGMGAEEAPLAGGGSDGNTVSALGVPTIDGLGPRGRGFHTTDEYVELDSFAPKAEALLRFLCSDYERLSRG